MKEENKIDSKIPSSGNDTAGIHPDVRAWEFINKDTIEWMTEVTNNNMTPRSDCG